MSENEGQQPQEPEEAFEDQDETSFICVVDPDSELAEQLFGNTLGFNSLTIKLKEPIPVIYSGIGPKLSHVLPHGIVISTDTCELGDQKNDGFHNFFVPWSQIVYMKQYIYT